MTIRYSTSIPADSGKLLHHEGDYWIRGVSENAAQQLGLIGEII